MIDFDTEEYYGGLYPSPPDPIEDDEDDDEINDYPDEERDREREVLGLWK